MSELGSKEMWDCLFEGCGWYAMYDPDDEYDEMHAEMKAEQHYEREHAGRVRIQVTIETEQMLGDRDPKDIREHELEKWEDRSHDVAHVRTEVLEEADDHDRIQRRDDT